MGFTRTYIWKVAALPTWWDDSLWDDPASRAVGHIHLSRHLGIEITSLQDASSGLRLAKMGVCKYMKRVGTNEEELLLSRAIASRAAQLAAAAMDRPSKAVPAATDLRAALLDQGPFVDFEALLDFCWVIGIPVLHVNEFPSDAKKKPMGFTLRAAGRPGIVLCQEKTQPAWQLFTLAHELGHLHHGHVPENGALFDETVRDNEPDAEESQANQYALQLLTGRESGGIRTDGRWPNAKTLAEQARDFGWQYHVDPGHVVLNCAHTISGRFWGIANAALNILDPQADAIRAIGDRLAANLDWERLPEDSSEFLMRITRQGTPE